MQHQVVVDGFFWTPEPWGRALRSRHLGQVADHLFTSLPLRLRGSAAHEEQEWAGVAASIGVPAERLLRLHQVHGNRVEVVRAGAGAPPVAAAGKARAEADIFVASDPAVAISIQVADCAPLLMADQRLGVVAAAHAGWRGTAANVAGTAVAALEREFGSRPADLVVAHGPCIGSCCYAVGEELVEAFREAGYANWIDRWFSHDGDGRLRLDLWAANHDQLAEAGVPPEQIHQSQLCTADHPEWFASYRRDGAGTGRIAAVIRARG